MKDSGNSWRQKAERAMTSRFYTIFMSLMTLFALFGDDIHLVGVKKEYDPIFYIISTIVLGFFLIELMLQSLVKPGYFIGFYFWLDLISTFSLIFDIGWIWDEATGTQDFSAKTAQ